MALESNTDIDQAADSTNRPPYVRKGANSWTRFTVTSQFCFFMKALALTFDFCLSTSIPVLTTSTHVVAWPQGDHILGGGLVAQGQGRTFAQSHNPLPVGHRSSSNWGLAWVDWCHSEVNALERPKAVQDSTTTALRV